jgi:choice-of-anchor C domain-containing protein
MKSILMSVMMIIIVAAPAAFGQITNGSFEDGVPIDNGFVTVSSGIDGWMVTSENVDYIGDYWQASDGLRSVDLNGSFVQSGVAQIINTTPAYTYQVTFDMSGNPDNGLGVKTMSVYGGGFTTTYTYEVTALNSRTDMRWEPRTFTFTAQAVHTTLRFMSDMATPEAYGPVIDNVRITNITGQVCHKTLGKPHKTLTIGVAAIPAHIAHGDTEGPCPD